MRGWPAGVGSALPLTVLADSVDSVDLVDVLSKGLSNDAMGMGDSVGLVGCPVPELEISLP